MTRRSRTVAAVVGGVAVLAATVLFLPGLLVWYDLGGVAVPAPDRLQALTDARTQLLQSLGGLVLALGAYATWRRLRINEEELRATRDGQVTERFTRAIEQLGSDKTDVRIGAVYALARLAHNSPDDRDAVIATLSAFVRGHSPWPPRLPDQPAADVPPADVPTLATRANDLQAAVTALGRLPRSNENEWVRMPQTDLRRARMWQLVLDGAQFTAANLVGASLWESSLVDTNLSGADLRGADLTGADLSRAILWGTDLSTTVLTDVTLAGAEEDADTRWPPDFEPSAFGVIRVSGDRRTRYRLRRRTPDGHA